MMKKLAIKIKADGLYVSSYNKKILKNFKEIIGASHNNSEINLKNLARGVKRLFFQGYLRQITQIKRLFGALLSLI